ncbi:hypothetical protein E2C01_101876 [Portunus trituberculatus]|nr:hypothetical protein [Portunus trituberculatus]
MIRKDR